MASRATTALTLTPQHCRALSCLQYGSRGLVQATPTQSTRCCPSYAVMPSVRNVALEPSRRGSWLTVVLLEW